MKETTATQFLVLQHYLTEVEPNEFSADRYYLAQVAYYLFWLQWTVATLFASSRPDQPDVTVETFLLKFGRPEDRTDAPDRPAKDPLRSKAVWAAAFGIDPNNPDRTAGRGPVPRTDRFGRVQPKRGTLPPGVRQATPEQRAAAARLRADRAGTGPFMPNPGGSTP